MELFRDFPVLLFTTQKEWHTWLLANYAQPKGVWLKLAKKAGGQQSVTYSEAVEEALCFGWIDGQVYRYDNAYYLQKFTPRNPKSVWSKINVAKVTALIDNGRMHPSGLQAVENAKLHGLWDTAYDSPQDMTTPDDFQAALNSHPKAKAFFKSLNRTNKYAFNWRIETAKRPETRQTRIEKIIEMLEKGQTFH